MNINLNNYEEYFLLYADNELSVKERMAVEEFVKANQHLKIEFNSLKDAIIFPDETLHFSDKSSLYKSTSSDFIDENNYEEIFVLYHDGELTVPEQKETKTFLLAHPHLKDEFTLLGLARIQSQEVSFPGKSSLYKKVPAIRSGRVIFFRAMAAATIAGLILWASLFYFQGNTNEQQIAIQIETKPVIINAPIDENESENENIPENKIEDEGTGADMQEPASIEEKDGKEGKAAPVLSPQKYLLAANTKARSGNQNTEKPKASGIPEEEMETIPESMEKDLLTKISPKEISLISNTEMSASGHIDIDETEIIINRPENLARTVVYLDVEKEESDGFFLNISANEFQKTKVGIFLKKVKRVAERNDPIRRLLAGEGQIVLNK